MIKIIRFKSDSLNFSKERKGIKSNTVRITDDWNKERWERFYNANYVLIQRTTDKKEFMRYITDKTVYKNIVVISW